MPGKLFQSHNNGNSQVLMHGVYLNNFIEVKVIEVSEYHVGNNKHNFFADSTSRATYEVGERNMQTTQMYTYIRINVKLCCHSPSVVKLTNWFKLK